MTQHGDGQDGDHADADAGESLQAGSVGGDAKDAAPVGQDEDER